MSKAHVTEWQATLNEHGYYLDVDGDFGPSTLKASLASLAMDAVDVPIHELPQEWLPASTKMKRIIAHWTAGSHNVSKTDKEHYHFIWSGDGDVVKGDKPVTANESTSDNDGYAAHTKGCNTGSIGVSLACMAGAVESPFNSGSYPMTKVQWDHMVAGIAQLCSFYGIPVSSTTVLSHAEVEGNLNIDQNGKWDYTRLSWDVTLVGAAACGNKLRADVRVMME